MKRDSRLAALDYLRFVMSHTGLTASVLAKKAGLSATTLTRALNDPKHKFALTTTTLEKLRAATGLDFAPFLQLDPFKIESEIEALADAWASIDGKIDDFRAGKSAPRIEDFGGHYEGYLADADELLKRLIQRGYRIVPVTKTDE